MFYLIKYNCERYPSDEPFEYETYANSKAEAVDYFNLHSTNFCRSKHTIVEVLEYPSLNEDI